MHRHLQLQVQYPLKTTDTSHKKMYVEPYSLLFDFVCKAELGLVKWFCGGSSLKAFSELGCILKDLIKKPGKALKKLRTNKE